MSAAASIAAALTKYGRPMTLKRRQGTTDDFDSVTVYGVDQATKSPDDRVDNFRPGDRTVTISDTEIAAQSDYAGPPQEGDILVVDGREWLVQGCNTRHLGAVALAHVLWIRG